MIDAEILEWLKQNKFIKPNGTLNGKVSQHAHKHPEIVNSDEWKAFSERTDFVGTRMDQRIHALENGLHSIPVCDFCKIAHVKFISRPQGYQPFCSIKCAQRSPATHAKHESTMLEKYGAKYTSHVPSIRQKQIDKCQEKYGSDTPFGSAAIQQKARHTTTTKYGVTSTALLPEVQSQQLATRLERYGVEYPFQSETLQDQIEMQTRNRFGGRTLSQRHMSDDTLHCLDNKAWLENEYLTKQQTASNIADILNISNTTVLNYLSKHSIPIRTATYRSSPEKEIESFIQAVYAGPVIATARGIIPPKELDLFLPDLSLAIEFDGLFWHREQHLKDRKYHLTKTNLCASQGIQLIHIFEHEWTHKSQICKSRLLCLIGKSERFFARNTTVGAVSCSQAREFFDRTHLQGFVPGTYYIGLYYNSQLIACMAFGKPRFSKTHEWELLRYSTNLNITVVGGASKLFKHFVKTTNATSIVSYADKRWSNGHLYTTLGFTQLKDSSPSYLYFSDVTKVYHRTSFQKHKLKHKLEFFDPSKTEYENMLANGYDRIWDCGNKVFVWYNVDNDG